MITRKASETANGGITLIIDDIEEANKKGREFIVNDIKRFEDMDKRGETCECYTPKRESTHQLDKMKVADFLLDSWEETDAVDTDALKLLTAAKKVIKAREKAWAKVKKNGPGKGIHFDPLANVARLRARYEIAKDIIDNADDSAAKGGGCADGLIGKFMSPSASDKAILRKVGKEWEGLQSSERQELGTRNRLIKWLDKHIPMNSTTNATRVVKPTFFISQRKESAKYFEQCIEAITTGGDGDWRNRVSDWVQRIMERVQHL